MTSMTEIRLGSTLGKKYGRSHRVHLDTKTPAEAMRWFFSQFPEARRFFATAHEKGIQFAVFRGRGESRENIGRDQLGEPGGDCITITPVHAGAKAGVLQLVLGIVLIVVGAFTYNPALISMGIGIALGGVVQMLTPQPKVNKNADSANNQSSYVFNGPTNTTAQGNCVPVVYGRLRVGSAVVSAGMDAEDYAAATSGVAPGIPGGSSKTSPYAS